MRRDEALLLDMLLAARKILRFSSGVDEATFLQNDLLQSAVMREIQVIGEAARMISDQAKATYAAIPWRPARRNSASPHLARFTSMTRPKTPISPTSTAT
jgi:uncharacterized protein with HEPN domain